MSDAKYEIAFYQTRDGECQVWDFLEGLRIKASTNKDARIQHKQASLYIELLSLNGTNMNENITKHLEEDIWEYKSKRKPKSVHSNNCSENIPKSVEKATDGKYQSKRNRNKKSWLLPCK